MNVLKIYTLNEDGTSTPFPNEYEQAAFDDYEYTASRMGGAPSITAKIKHRLCLDNLWTEKQYVEFRGCKYFVRDTPSSSKDNNDTRYEHDVTFLHERFVLENVYMLDSVFTDEKHPDAQPETDKYVSNSTKVVFWGDVHEFAGRFNACLYAAGLGGSEESGGFYVVVDEDITSEETLVAFEDKYFSEALQEIFNVFKLPYYWVGNCCHIGLAPEELSEVFEYGAENALLSIEKQNNNQGYCNRATGVGSSDNIPYYYPRNTSPDYTEPHAVEGNRGITGKIDVIDRSKFDKLEAVLPTGSPWNGFGIQYSGNNNSAQAWCTGVYLWTPVDAAKVGEATQRWNDNVTWALGALLYQSFQQRGGLSFDPCQWVGISADAPHYMDGAGGLMEGDENVYLIKDIWNKIQNKSFAGGRNYLKAEGDWYGTEYMLSANAFAKSAPKSYRLAYTFGISKGGDYCMITFPIGFYRDGISQEMDISTIQMWIAKNDLSNWEEVNASNIIPVGSEYDSLGRRCLKYVFFGLSKWAAQGSFSIIIQFKPRKYKCWLPTDSYSNKYVSPYNESLETNYTDGGRVEYFRDGDIWGTPTGNHTISFNGKNGTYDVCWLNVIKSIGKKNHINIGSPSVQAIPSCWHKIGSLQISDVYKGLDAFGLSSSQTPQDGDRIVRMYVLDDIETVPTQNTLMPTIYRDTKGKESFYNALNEDSLAEDKMYAQYDSFYEDTNGDNYVFEHEFLQENPRETKYNFPDIKPTIEGIVGTDGQLLDRIVAVAFDRNDHDYIRGETLYKTGEDYADELKSDSEYDHPYFFVKIQKTNANINGQDCGFNLFDSVTENDMQLSLKSGDCGGCTFRIMVTKDTNKNPVLTDGNGNLLRDQYGRVRLIGANNGKGYSLDATQQNTKTNSVWLCLEKETDTYGMLMPNVSSDFRPKAGEKFVLLNINLPLLYIKEAEARLSKAIIEQMWKDNSEKFSFNINFSRVYFEENPSIMSILSENSKIYVRYNGLTIPLFVNNYSYKMSSNSPLPEVTVDLRDEISIGTAYKQNIQSDISEPISSLMGGIGGMSMPVISSDDNTTNASDGNLYSALKVLNTFLNKKSEDTAEGLIHFLQGIDVKGLLQAARLYVDDNVEIGEFLQGLVGAVRGVQITRGGEIIAKSLRLEESLIVPSITYNRAMVLDGIFIVAPSYGEIATVEYKQSTSDNGNPLYIQVDEDGSPIYEKDGKRVGMWDGTPILTEEVTAYPKYENRGVATLKLERGEFGSIREGDMLLGFWGDVSCGAESDFDGVWNEEHGCYDRNGDFGLSGFASVYMLVTKVDENSPYGQRFEYELRCDSDPNWYLDAHPAEGMKFYGFGNISDKERQSIYIITRDYSVRLINKDTWRYNENNIIEIHGKLDGFSMFAENDRGETYVKRFSGYGNVIGNSYIFGQIDKFERVSYKMEIDTGGDTFIGVGETKTLTFTVIDGYGVEQTPVKWSVTRSSNKTNDDKVWNAQHKDFSGILKLTLADDFYGIDRATFTVVATMSDKRTAEMIVEM